MQEGHSHGPTSILALLPIAPITNDPKRTLKVYSRDSPEYNETYLLHVNQASPRRAYTSHHRPYCQSCTRYKVYSATKNKIRVR